MKICDTNNHGEIALEGRDCEACEVIADLREQIKELEDELERIDKGEK